MKKYVKPELFYEHYELSQHIADCALEWTNLTDEYTCAATPDIEKIPIPFTLFSNRAICTLLPGEWLDYCYQGGAPNANLFKS